MNEISLFLTSFHPSLKEDARDPLIRVIKASIKPPHKQETKTQLRTRAEPNSVQTGASGEVSGNRLNSRFLVAITQHHIHTPQEGGSLLIYSLS